jgi:tetratricopeptide (TPR) repeat protein
VYKDKNILRLLNNYGAAFMRTSQYAHSVNDYDNAIKYMEKSFGFIERKQRFYPEISKLYLEASFNFLQQTENNDAFSYLKKAVQYDIHNQEWPQIIFRIAQFSESYDESIALLNTLRSYQDDLVLDEIITQINLLKE